MNQLSQIFTIKERILMVRAPFARRYIAYIAASRGVGYMYVSCILNLWPKMTGLVDTVSPSSFCTLSSIRLGVGNGIPAVNI